MKFKRLATFLTASLMLGGILGFVLNQASKPVKVNAATDINDYSACETAHNNGNASSLFSALQTITAPGKAGSYDGLYTTYKSAYLRSDGKIFDYYSKITNYDPDKDRAGSYKAEGDCFNREHSIPKSWWGGSTSNQGADPFIVVPTDGYVNNRRSAFPFGMVSSATYSASGNFAKLGSAVSSWGYSGTVFEPDDSLKGDFARVYFYAIVKYSAYGWTGNGGSTCFSGSTNTNFGLTNYSVKLFSYWHNLDPVDAWELHANDAIAGIQGNRNPFIDHPEYTDTLFKNNSGYTPYNHGAPSSDNISISKTSASLTVDESTTITATPSDSSVSVSWTNSNSSVASISSTSGKTITVTGVSEGTATVTASATINGTKYSKDCTVTVTTSGGGGGGGDDPLPVEGDVTLNIDFTQSNYSDTDNVGNVWTADGSYNTGSYLRLNNNAYISNSPALSVDTTQTISVKAMIRTYGNGNGRSLQFTAYNTNGTAITNTATLTPTDNKLKEYSGTLTFNTTAYNEVIIKAIHNGTGEIGVSSMEIEYTAVSSSTKTLTSISVSDPKTIYTQGDTLVKPTVTAHYDDSSSVDVTSSAVFSGYNMSTIGEQTVIVTYNTESTSYTINVYAPVVVTSLFASGYVDTFTEGDEFSFGGTVTATFSDSTTDEVEDDCTFSGYNMSTIGNQTVTVTYSGKTTTYGITVNHGELYTLLISGQKTNYVVGDTFSFNGVATAVLNNGYQKVVTPTSVTSPNMSTAGEKTIVVSYTYYGVTKTAEYTINVSTQKSSVQIAYEACAALADGATSSNEYEFTGTVTGMISNNFFVQDGDYAMYVYCGSTSKISQSDIGKSVTVKATLKNYGGLYETGTISKVTVNGAGETITPATVTSYDSIANSNQSILSNLTSGVIKVKTSKGSASGTKSDWKITITVGGQDLVLIGNKYLTNLSTLNNIYDSSDFKVGAYISVDNLVTSVHNNEIQLSLTETSNITIGYSLSSFCHEFLGNMVCNPQGTTAPAFVSGYSWSDLSDLYELLSSEDQQTLKNANANQSGTLAEQVAARYDLLLDKYGIGMFPNFMNRPIIYGANFNNKVIDTKSISLLLIIVCASIMSLGALVIIKKKKQK